jgi:hypothetical protein
MMYFLEPIALINVLLPTTLGFAVGFILSLTGAGGAILSVPLLVFGMGLTVSQAGPIGLLAVSISAGIGSIFGFKERILRYKAAGLMALFGLVLSPIGLYIAHQVPNKPLTLIFSIVLFYSSGRMLIQSYRERKGIIDAHPKAVPCHLNHSIGKLIWTVPCARALAFAGAIAGFFSGLLGVGGGFIIVPALKKFTDLPVNSIVATSLGVLTLVSLGGVINSTFAGLMLWSIAIPFATGSLFGLMIGRTIAKRLAGPTIQYIFALFSFGVAILMGLKGLS